MLHIEHLRKADESYEVRHDNNGNAIHSVVKDGEAIVYPTLLDLIEHQFLGRNSVERFYCTENTLNVLYEENEYDYYKLKKQTL